MSTIRAVATAVALSSIVACARAPPPKVVAVTPTPGPYAEVAFGESRAYCAVEGYLLSRDLAGQWQSLGGPLDAPLQPPLGYVQACDNPARRVDLPRQPPRPSAGASAVEYLASQRLASALVPDIAATLQADSQ